MPFKMGMIMTLNNSINKKPSSRATLQPGYNQTSISNTSMKQVNSLQTRTNISRVKRYSMVSVYSTPRGSGGG